MKSTILALAVGAAALLGTSTVAEAGPRFSFGFSNGHFRAPFHGSNHFGSSSNIHNYVGGSFRSSGHCAPAPYHVRTDEVCRRTECRTAYTSCGRPYTYHVTIVTYRDIYSNGTSRTYTRTFS